MNASLLARWRSITLAAEAFVLLVVCTWQFNTGVLRDSVLRAAIFSVPALLPLRGLMKGDRYTYRWATLCVLPYFVVALTEAFANPAARTFAIALLGGSLIWFFALVAYLRVSAASAAASPPPPLPVAGEGAEGK